MPNGRGTPLFLLIGFVTLLALVSVVVIIVKAPSTQDQLALIGAVIAFVAPLVTSLIALLRAEHANGTATAAVQVVADHLNAEENPKP